VDSDMQRKRSSAAAPSATAPISGPENRVVSISQIAREHGVTLRALRFYQAKGLLTPAMRGKERLFAAEDCERLALILQGKRLGFTLTELRQMLSAWRAGMPLPVSRKVCVEQIKLLERQRCGIDNAIRELRDIYSRMLVTADRTAVAQNQS